MNGVPLRLLLLVVDDDDVDRERVIRLLARTTLMAQAMEASSSAGALKLLRKYEFDCVVLDNQLGDGNGAELLPAIRREALRECPVIMITGAGSEALAVQALQEGATDYLTKFQLNADSLARAIRRALELHKMRTEIDELHRNLERRVEEQAAAIVQSERDLRAILDHTPSVVGYWDIGLHNRFGNRAYRTWFGADPETLPGRHLRDVVGAGQFERLLPRVEAVLGGQAQFFEQDFLAPDDVTLRHAQLSFHPDFGDDETPRGFYSTITDVSAIKRAQARAEELAAFSETVFNASPIGLGVFGQDGQCVMGNQNLAALVGGASENLRGRSLEQMFGAAPALAEASRATLADGLSRRSDVDSRLQDTDTALQLSCALARVNREGQAHLLLAAQDIREQRRAHDALVAARNAAETAAHAKSAFLANMSHEIRTPMNAIVGLTRLALEDELPDGARNYLDKVHQSSIALMGILDDVLDYSKIEAGQLRFEHVPFDLEKTLQRVVDLFAARIEQKGLEFGVELALDLPPRVVGDPLRLSQVLNNLVGNAVKFTETGQIHLSVGRSRAEQAPADELRFSVRDSGPGIEAERQKDLFQAFSQGDASITRRYGGTGLGLAICRRLVARMDGNIGVDSEVGRGSDFWFTARLHPVDASPLPPLPELDGLRVLVVDRSTTTAAILDDRLQAWQVSTERASELAAAIAALSQARSAGHPFDAALLDWQLPGVDGETAMRRLREAAGQTPPLFVVAMRNATGQAIRSHSAERPPDAVLAKPVLPGALREALAELRTRRAAPAATGRQAAPRSMPAPLLADRLRERGRPLQGATILLVEDNELNRIVAQGFLQRMGVSVRIAVNGAEALEQLQSGDGAVDAVLMDLHMPVLDGLEATRRIRALPAFAKLPIIGMTAAAMPEDRDRCIAAGMVDHVAKPVMPESLLEALLHWIGPARQAEASATASALPAFDTSTLEVLLHGDEPKIWSLLTKFLRLEEDSAAQIGTMIASGDATAAGRRLHDLRGSAGTLGALDVARTALVLEKALRNAEPTELALTDFNAALEVSLAQLRAALAGRRNRH